MSTSPNTPSSSLWQLMAPHLGLIALSFTLENGDGRYTFNLPEMEVNGDWPDGAATDVIEVKVSEN